MIRLRWLLAFFAVALLPTLGFAQERGRIAGQVVDESTGQPLVGAQVFVGGTGLGAITNQDGRYLISNVPAGVREVRVSLIGYARGTAQVTVTPAETAVADLVLRVSAVELDAITVTTVTGQALRRRELGTNTGAISLADVEQGSVTSLADVLTGRTSGLMVQDISGTTGTSQRIRIRGANSISLSNEPLIFIDGIRANDSFGGTGVGGQNRSRLNDINPNDIENIEVVKGPAATAIYGTAAANGVLLITTKRGRSGAARFSVYSEVGSLSDRNPWPLNYFAYQVNDPDEPLFTSAGLFNRGPYTRCANHQAAAGTCRQDAFVSFNTLKDARTTPFSTGNRQQYGVSVAGGAESITYYLSVDREEEQGIIRFNDLEKTNLRANVHAQLRPDLGITVTSGYTNSTLALNNNDNSILSPLINGILGAPAFIPWPEGGPHWNNFGWGFVWADREDQEGIVHFLEDYIVFQDVDRFHLGAVADYRPLPWLTANLNVGLDYTNRHDFITLQPDRINIAPSWTIDWRNSNRNNRYIWTTNAAATATFNLRENVVSTTTAGGSFERDRFQSTTCFGAGIVEGTSSCSATSSLFSIGEAFTEIVTVGGFVRQQLALNDRIFVAGSVRGDDNSAFGAEFGLAYYPSASLSWVIGEEPWFPESRVLSSLRLRTAYGESGLRPGFRDAETLFEPVAVTNQGNEVSAVTLNTTGNELLKPERTQEIEAGFDAGFFEGRVSLDFTFFNKRSRDALIRRRIAPSFGLTQDVFFNLGKVQNRGTELGLNALALDMENVRLNVRFTNSTLSNKILEMGEGVEDIIINRGEQRHKEGFPAGAYFQRPISWEDPDGDGLLTLADVTAGPEAVFLGPMLPKWQRTLSLDLRLFRWVSVGSLFEGRGGHMQLDGTERFRCATGFNRTSGTAGADRGCRAVFGESPPLEEQAAFIASATGVSRAGHIHKANFVKWRELSFRFDAPASLGASVPALRGASLTLAARNLKTWTDYPGIDPEANETGGAANFNQAEFNSQPAVRYFIARVTFAY